MSTINQNDVTECEICFTTTPVYNPLITCTHSHTFCEECIKKWLAGGHLTCPKCRAIWSPVNDVEEINEPDINIINPPPVINYNLPSSIQFPPSSTANGIGHNTLICFSIGLLLGLIIYPAIK